MRQVIRLVKGRVLVTNVFIIAELTLKIFAPQQMMALNIMTCSQRRTVMPNVHEMVKKHLEENGYDGLYSAGNCACKIDDLFPCGQTDKDCEAGYLQPCDGSCDMGKCDWHIGNEKK